MELKESIARMTMALERQTEEMRARRVTDEGMKEELRRIGKELE